METKNLKALTRWTLPDNYAGAHWPEYFVFLAQHRDSDSITRSNFVCGLKAIGGETDTVIVVREGHWAVGWVEWIAVHESDVDALEKADNIACALKDYPVVSDDHLSEIEWDEAADYWQRASVRERAEICARLDLSIFAARHDYMPADDTGALLEYLRH